MNIIQTQLPGLLLIQPKIFGDARGYFFESYREDRYQEMGIACSFVQDNASRSEQGVLRGLHFQTQHAQDKLVTVTRGEVFDVAVDIRRNSPTFGQSYGTILSDQNHHQLFVPKGFAHGFYVISAEGADFHYKCSDYYQPQFEAGIIWNDPDLNIQWPLHAEKAILQSQKDQVYLPLKNLDPSLLPLFQE